jgi:glucokinase
MYYIGIDLGGTNIAAGIVNEDGQIIYKESIPTQKKRNQQAIMEDMAKLSLKLLDEAGIKFQELQSIGVGSPGSPNPDEGIIIYNNNLGFRNAPIRKVIQKEIPVPVYLDNDANCAALAEGLLGAAGGVKYSVTITLGTGIGGGIIMNNEIYSGFNNAGAELGHMVILSGGKECTCGRKGCWEAYASATALIKLTQEAALKNHDSLLYTLVDGDLTLITAKTSFDAAKQGDPVANKVVQDYIGYLSEGVINIINIFQPEILVLGGGVSKQGDYLLNLLLERINQDAYSREEIPKTKLRTALLGNDAGIIGAALLGFSQEQLRMLGKKD